MANKKTNKEVNQMFYPILPYGNLDKDHRLKLWECGTLLGPTLISLAKLFLKFLFLGEIFLLPEGEKESKLMLVCAHRGSVYIPIPFTALYHGLGTVIIKINKKTTKFVVFTGVKYF